MNSYLSISRWTRGWIIFAQILGTALAVIGLAIWADMAEQAKSSLVGSVDNEAAYAAILALFAYLIWKSAFNAIIIIYNVVKMDDMTLSANKWIISALSLTVGGIFTPLMISSFPNVNIKSTISPKVFLAKVMGITMLIGGPLFIIVYSAYLGSDGITVAKSVSTIVYVILGLETLFGLLTTGFFFQPNANQKFHENSNANVIAMKILSSLVNIILTIELIGVMLEALMELIGAFARAFQGSGSNNGAMNFLFIIYSIFYLFITMVYVGFVWWVTGQTIKGIWQDQVSFTAFEPLQNQRNQTAHVTN